MRPGDVFVTNDPWFGTGHLFDYRRGDPGVSRGARPVGLFASTCHTRRRRRRLLGRGALGLRGGHLHSAPAPARAGRRRTRSCSRSSWRTRATRSRRAATSCRWSACNDVGAARLVDMMARVRARQRSTQLAAHILEHSREATREAIAPAAARPLATRDDARRLRVADQLPRVPRHRGRRDHRGLSRAARRLSARGINSPQCYTEAYSVFGLKCIIAPAIPNNAGSLAPFGVLAEDGSIVASAAPGARHRAARDRADAARPDVRLPSRRRSRARARRERRQHLGAADGRRRPVQTAPARAST